jgi:hypothetical protein
LRNDVENGVDNDAENDAVFTPFRRVNGLAEKLDTSRAEASGNQQSTLDMAAGWAYIPA